MNVLYLIGAAVSVLLFAYLGWALVRAEDF